MCPHVSSDRTALWEPSVADRTFERLLPTVSAKVSSKVGCLSERLLANRTLVGFLTGVGAKMCLQCRLPSIGLATYVTVVGSREWLVSLLQRMIATSRKSIDMYSTCRIVRRIVAQSCGWSVWRGVSRMQSSIVERVSVWHGCLMKMDDGAMYCGTISKAMSAPWEVIRTGSLVRGQGYSRGVSRVCGVTGSVWNTSAGIRLVRVGRVGGGRWCQWGHRTAFLHFDITCRISGRRFCGAMDNWRFLLQRHQGHSSLTALWSWLEGRSKVPRLQIGPKIGINEWKKVILVYFVVIPNSKINAKQTITSTSFQLELELTLLCKGKTPDHAEVWEMEEVPLSCWERCNMASLA